MDFLSNGFKNRNTSGHIKMEMVMTMTYMAFMKEPIVANVKGSSIPTTAT